MPTDPPPAPVDPPPVPEQWRTVRIGRVQLVMRGSTIVAVT